MLTNVKSNRVLTGVLAVAVASLSLPHQRAQGMQAPADPSAARTAPAADAETTGERRRQLARFLQRDDVRAALAAYGMSADDVSARIDHLTGAELAMIGARIDELAAAGQHSKAFAPVPSPNQVAAVAFVALAAVVVVIALIVKGFSDPSDPSGKDDSSLGADRQDLSADDRYQLGHNYLAQGRLEAGWMTMCTAARQGSAEAQNVLGYFYEGRGRLRWRSAEPPPVRIDPALAYLWYGVAASNGVKEAAFLRDNLSERLSPDELGKAGSVASAWRATVADCDMR